MTVAVSDQTPGRWGRVLRYGFGGFLCLLAVAAVWVGGAPWYVGVGILCTAAIIMLGQRQLFRPGVVRTTDEVICRYIPWYEGTAYLTCVAIPLLGLCTIAAGHEPDSPAWIRICGIVLVGIGPVLLWSVVRLWYRYVLCISASALALRTAMLWSKPVVIRREQIESVTPKVVAIQPVNLANALLAWHAGAAGDPTELLDRVERILRGRAVTSE